jgi:L-fuconolactonase
LDHIAKPHIAQGLMQPWRILLTELARAENVSCKISGLVTEADWKNWKDDDFRPYLDVVGELFGPERLMFGSDWPVCLLAAEYKTVINIARGWLERTFPNDLEKIFGENCARFYKIKV